MNDRQKKLLLILKKSGHLSISEQAASFDVSEMTIRRDLDALEKMGEASRIHGGRLSNLPQAEALIF